MVGSALALSMVVAAGVEAHTADWWRALAIRLARHGRPRAAAAADEQARKAAGGDSDDERVRLFDLARTGEMQPTSDDGTRAAAWIAAEAALTRGDAAEAQQQVELARNRARATAESRILMHAYCEPPEAETHERIVLARAALAANDPAAAVAMLRPAAATPEAALLLAKAMIAGRDFDDAERQLRAAAEQVGEVSDCHGALLEQVEFVRANLLWERDRLDDAADAYRDLIGRAEERERRFSSDLVRDVAHESRNVAEVIVRGARLPSAAAPEARNNLGQLLLLHRDASHRVLQLVEARRLFAAAAVSPDYTTRQYAYLGLARAEIEGGEAASGVQSLATALWIDPRYADALDFAAEVMKSDDVALATEAGIAFLGAAPESLTHAFAMRTYGPSLDAAANLARGRRQDVQSAWQFTAMRDLYDHHLSAAERESSEARAQLHSSRWPDAVLAQAYALAGKTAKAAELLRKLAETTLRPLNAAETAALRGAFGTYQAIARSRLEGARADRAMATVARFEPGVAMTFPWPRFETINGTITDLKLGGSAKVVVLTSSGTREVTIGSDGEYSIELPPGMYALMPSAGDVKGPLHIAEHSDQPETIALAFKPVAEPITSTVASFGEHSVQSVELFTIPTSRRLFAAVASTVSGSQSSENSYVVDGAAANVSIDGVNSMETLVTAGQDGGRFASLAEKASISFGDESMVSIEGNTVRLSAPGKFTTTQGKVESLLVMPRLTAAAEPVALPVPRRDSRTQRDIRVAAGVPLIPGDLWIYVSGELSRLDGAAAEEPVRQQGGSTDRSIANFVKLTHEPSEEFNEWLTLQSSHSTRRGIVEDAFGIVNGSVASNSRANSHNSEVLAWSGDRQFGRRLGLNVLASYVNDHSSIRPGSAASDVSQRRVDIQDFFATGGIGFVNDGRNYSRFNARASSRFDTGLRFANVSHAGFDATFDRDALDDRMSGGYMVDVPRSVGAEAQGIIRYWSVDGLFVPEVRETFRAEDVSAFTSCGNDLSPLAWTATLQYRWQVAKFPARQSLHTGAIQPHFGVTYSPRESRWGITGNATRFVEPLTPDERIAFGSSRRYVAGESAYGGIAKIDPHLRPRTIDSASAGFFVFEGDTKVDVSVVHYRLRHEVEDSFCTPDLRRCIGNPGEGVLSEIRTLGGAIAPSPRAQAQWTSLHSSIMRRGHLSWPFDASLDGLVQYTWQRNRGNIESPDMSSTRISGIDPYARPAFDFLELVPPVGPLARERRHDVIVNGAAAIKGSRTNDSFKVSVLAHWHTGEPRAAFAYSDLYGRYVTYVERRGAEGDSPAVASADVSLLYHYAMAETSAFEIGVSLENIFNRQTATIDDQRIFLTDPSIATIPNSKFLTPMTRLAPFALQVIARFVF